MKRKSGAIMLDEFIVFARILIVFLIIVLIILASTSKLGSLIDLIF